MASRRTLSVVDSNIEKNKRINILAEKDKGTYDAMNKGIRLAKGDWLYFLGSDDVLYNQDVLQKVLDTWFDFNSLN